MFKIYFSFPLFPSSLVVTIFVEGIGLVALHMISKHSLPIPKIQISCPDANIVGLSFNIVKQYCCDVIFKLNFLPQWLDLQMQ